MTQRSQIDRVLEVWMADGPTAMPDSVVDVVADRVSVQRQRRSWRLLRRLPMNPIFKLGAAAAAVLIIAVVGWNLLPERPGGTGGQSTPSPASTPSQATAETASPAPTPPWWDASAALCGLPVACAGELAPGGHSSGSFQPSVTYTVPAGWVNTADWHDREDYFALLPDTPANRAAAGRDAVAQSIVIVPHASLMSDDCVSPQVGLSAAEIADALATRDGIAASEPVTVTISGLSGRQLDVGLEPGWTASCPQDSGSPAVPLVGSWTAQGEERYRIVILDTPTCGETVQQGPACASGGNITIVIYAEQAADFAALVAAAMPIVETFEFVVSE
jgi:hypothetical protein